MKLRNALIGAAILAAVNAACAQAPEAPPGAAACSGCHAQLPGVETQVPRLKGIDAALIADAMLAYKSGAREATIMDRIAKGFSDDEIRAIATWYATQKD